MRKTLTALALVALLLAGAWIGLRLHNPHHRPIHPAPSAATPAASAPVTAAAVPPITAIPAVAAGSTEAADPETEAIRSEARALEATGDLAGAAALIEQKLQALPGNQILARDLSRLLDAQGWRNYDTRELPTARGFFKEALFHWAGNQEALRGLAFVSMEENNRAEAEDWIRQYFAAGGDRPEVYALQGRISYEGERLTEAMYYFGVSLALDPNQPEIAGMLEKIKRENRVESNFQRQDSRHFIIKYEGQELPEVWEMVESVCEDAYVEIGRRLDHYPELPVTVILYTDRQFQDATRMPAWAEAIFDGKIRIPAKGLSSQNGDLTRIVMHEYAHAVVHDLSRGRAPIWLHEGIAQFYEGTPTDVPGIARRILAGGGPLPLSSIEGMFVVMPEQQAELAYIESRLVAIYLSESQGPFVLREILRRLGDGASIADAIRGATGRSYSDLDADFRAWVQKQAGQ